VLPHTPHSLDFSLSMRSGSLAQPLPAEEQLALLFHLAESTPLVGTPLEKTSCAPQTLRDAYRTCHHITRQHSKSFFFSTQFLPSAKRRGVRALYAFCRTSDDTVDMADEDPARELADWVCQARKSVPPLDNPVLLAWHDTRIRYHIPASLVDELLAGIAMDLTINRYATFSDLWIYCYRVASVVGLLSACILGSAPGAESYAIKLGVALQLTNILRDVGEDARRGRVYLPEDELAWFGLTANDILAGVCDERFRAMMRFQISRTHRLYEESWPGIAMLSPDSRLSVGVAAQVYRGILYQIVRNDYDVYTKRAHLSLSEKLVLLPTIWRSVRRLERQS
jgi:15-cis-phytoene synthase